MTSVTPRLEYADAAWRATASSSILSSFFRSTSDASSSGEELHYGVANGSWSLQLLTNASLTDAAKGVRSGPDDPSYDRQIPYAPVGTGSISCSVQEGRVRFALSQIGTGSRFTTMASSPSLPAHTRTDANATWTGDWNGVKIRLRLEVNSVFDTNHDIYEHYPTPGRTARVTAGVTC